MNEALEVASACLGGSILTGLVLLLLGAAIGRILARNQGPQDLAEDR